MKWSRLLNESYKVVMGLNTDGTLRESLVVPSSK